MEEKMMKKSEILENRKKWIEKLLDPASLKHKNCLQHPVESDKCCCLGWACVALGVEFVRDNGVLPEEQRKMLSMWGQTGGSRDCSHLGEWEYVSLSRVNDNTDATPQDIGRYLESVIEGGEHTPFIPLSNFS